MSKRKFIPPPIRGDDPMPEVVFCSYIITKETLRAWSITFAREDRRARKRWRRYQHQKRKQ